MRLSPGLSVAMIVRNEAQHLAQAIGSVQALAEEIILIDTGSEDDTVAIAQAQGARVYERPWPGDFAAARNEALALCNHAWIFVLDGDEVVAEEDHLAFRALLQDPPAAWRFETRNYTHASHLSEFHYAAPDDPHRRAFPGCFTSAKVRLFPNHPEARFEGVIHELINPSLERLGVPIRTTEIPIHHYAEEKNAAAQATKQALYLALGRAKAEADPENPQAHAELGHQCLASGDIAGALRAYKAALALRPEYAELWGHLGGALYHAGHPAKAEEAYRLALRHDPSHAEAWRNLAVCAMDRAAWTEALDAYDHALQHAPEHSETHRGRALALHHLGRIQEARHAAQQALTHAPTNPAARELLKALGAEGET